MITVKLNSKPLQIEKDMVLDNALEQWGYSNLCFALALNQNFIAKSKYNTITLSDGDEIEIVAPMQGG